MQTARGATRALWRTTATITKQKRSLPTSGALAWGSLTTTRATRPSTILLEWFAATAYERHRTCGACPSVRDPHRILLTIPRHFCRIVVSLIKAADALSHFLEFGHGQRLLQTLKEATVRLAPESVVLLREEQHFQLSNSR